MVQLNLRQKAGVAILTVGLVLALWAVVFLFFGSTPPYGFWGLVLAVLATAVVLLAPRYLIANDVQ